MQHHYQNAAIIMFIGLLLPSLIIAVPILFHVHILTLSVSTLHLWIATGIFVLSIALAGLYMLNRPSYKFGERIETAIEQGNLQKMKQDIATAPRYLQQRLPRSEMFPLVSLIQAANQQVTNEEVVISILQDHPDIELGNQPLLLHALRNSETSEKLILALLERTDIDVIPTTHKDDTDSRLVLLCQKNYGQHNNLINKLITHSAFTPEIDQSVSHLPELYYIAKPQHRFPRNFLPTYLQKVKQPLVKKAYDHPYHITYYIYMQPQRYTMREVANKNAESYCAFVSHHDFTTVLREDFCKAIEDRTDLDDKIEYYTYVAFLLDSIKHINQEEYHILYHTLLPQDSTDIVTFITAPLFQIKHDTDHIEDNINTITNNIRLFLDKGHTLSTPQQEAIVDRVNKQLQGVTTEFDIIERIQNSFPPTPVANRIAALEGQSHLAPTPPPSPENQKKAPQHYGLFTPVGPQDRKGSSELSSTPRTRRRL